MFTPMFTPYVLLFFLLLHTTVAAPTTTGTVSTTTITTTHDYPLPIVISRDEPISARDTRNIIQLLEKIPQCGVQCILASAPSSTCAPTDVACGCEDEVFRKAVQVCLQRECGAVKAIETAREEALFCRRPVRSRRLEIWGLLAIQSLAVICVVLRIVSRWITLHLFEIDDYIMMFCLLLFIAFTVVGYTAAMMAFGVDVWTVPPDDITRGLKLFYVDEGLYLFVLCLTKLSILFFYLRIFPHQWFRRATYTTMGLCILTCVLFAMVTIFQCVPVRYVWRGWMEPDIPHHCLNTSRSSLAAGVCNAFLDLVILVLPLPLLMQLKVTFRAKMGIIVMFSLGAFTLATACVRLTYMVHFSKSWANPTWDQTDVLIWSGLEVGISMIITSLPAIRVLFKTLLPNVFTGISRSKRRSDVEGVLAETPDEKDQNVCHLEGNAKDATGDDGPSHPKSPTVEKGEARRDWKPKTGTITAMANAILGGHLHDVSPTITRLDDQTPGNASGSEEVTDAPRNPVQPRGAEILPTYSSKERKLSDTSSQEPLTKRQSSYGGSTTEEEAAHDISIREEGNDVELRNWEQGCRPVSTSSGPPRIHSIAQGLGMRQTDKKNHSQGDTGNRDTKTTLRNEQTSTPTATTALTTTNLNRTHTPGDSASIASTDSSFFQSPQNISLAEQRPRSATSTSAKFTAFAKGSVAQHPQRHSSRNPLAKLFSSVSPDPRPRPRPDYSDIDLLDKTQGTVTTTIASMPKRGTADGARTANTNTTKSPHEDSPKSTSDSFTETSSKNTPSHGDTKSSRGKGSEGRSDGKGDETDEKDGKGDEKGEKRNERKGEEMKRDMEGETGNRQERERAGNRDRVRGKEQEQEEGVDSCVREGTNVPSKEGELVKEGPTVQSQESSNCEGQKSDKKEGVKDGQQAGEDTEKEWIRIERETRIQRGL